MYHISQEVKKNTIENAKRGKEKGPGPTWPIDVTALLGLFGWGNKEMEKHPMRRLQPPSTSQVFQVSSPSFPSSIASPLSKNSLGAEGGSTIQRKGGLESDYSCIGPILFINDHH